MEKAMKNKIYEGVFVFLVTSVIGLFVSSFAKINEAEKEILLLKQQYVMVNAETVILKRQREELPNYYVTRREHATYVENLTALLKEIKDELKNKKRD